MKKPVPIGDQELRLLRHIARAGPCTVGEAADAFGAQHGLARSTVLTVMERLRGKGYLTRKKDDGVYRYASVAEDAELVRGVVGSFVEKALGGSVSPFVSYLAEEAEDISDEELRTLQGLVARLEARRKG